MRTLSRISDAVSSRKVVREFNPTQPGGLVAWLDASLPMGYGTTQLNDGDLVAKWADLSGNGRHALQATSTKQPIWISNAAGTGNLLTVNQSSVETDTSGFYAWNGCTIARSTAQAAVGTASLAITSTIASGTMTVDFADASGGGTRSTVVLPNTQYTAVYSLLPDAATPVKQFNVGVRYLDSAGAIISTDTAAAHSTEIAGQWVQASYTFTTPANANSIVMWVEIFGTTAVGEIHYADKFGLYLGTKTAWTPTLASNVGSGPIIKFDGANDIVGATGLGGAIPNASGTVYVVAKQDNLSNTGYVFQSDANTRTYMQIGAGNAQGIVGNPAVFGTASTGAKLGSRGLFTLAWDSTQFYEYVNNIAVGSPTAYTAGSASSVYNVGAHPSGSSYFSGNIIAVLVYNTTHSDSLRASISNWLADKYSFTLS